MASYRVRISDGKSRKEVSRKGARNTKDAIGECLRIARQRPGDYAVAQSTRRHNAGILTEAYLVRYMTPAELEAAKSAVAESDEDLLIAAMGLVPGPWSGPGAL